jgi:signal peptidase
MSPPSGASDANQSEHGEKKGREAWERADPDDEDDGDSLRLFARDLATSVAAVLLLGAYLFAISGVWPPMVAIESGSMEPNMQINDLAFVMDTDRFQPGESRTVGPGDTGVVTAAVGDDTGYSQFGRSGDVIVFNPNGNSGRTPIIHRAMFWVEQGENWCEHEAADQTYLSNADQCIAPHDGFITKGDDNPTYDQAGDRRITAPVKPGWIVGTAEVRIPWLGWFRLQT